MKFSRFEDFKESASSGFILSFDHSRVMELYYCLCQSNFPFYSYFTLPGPHWTLSGDKVSISFFGSSRTYDRSITHPKVDLTEVRTHDLQLMTVHFMSLRSLL